MREKILLYINGVKKEICYPECTMMLSEYLRYDQCLTGTKVVCSEGDCGACSVLKISLPPTLVSKKTATYKDSPTFIPINSCITPVATLDSSSILTIEALGKTESELSEVQNALVESHGTQCGFCTPGFVMSFAGLMEERNDKNEHSQLTNQELKNSMTGNLCRCTGYQPILNAAKLIKPDKYQNLKNQFLNEAQKELLLQASTKPLLIKSKSFTFYAPTNLKDAALYIEKNQEQQREVQIIGSATDLGVMHNKRKMQLTNLLSLHLITDQFEINEFQKDSNSYVSIGSRVTISEFRNFLKTSLPEAANYLDVFASPQIKNLATVMGNICTASPIGDCPPLLIALEAKIKLVSHAGERELLLEEFYLDYRKTQLRKNEIATQLTFKMPDLHKKNSIFRIFKNANRKDLDISTLNLAIKISDIHSEQKNNIIIVAGGVAATTIRLKNTEKSLAEYLKNFDFKQSSLNIKEIDKVSEKIHTDFQAISDLRASKAYRHIIAQNLFRRTLFEHLQGVAN